MLILRPELCQVLTQDERARLFTALDALSAMVLDSKARWRVMQLEGVLCKKPDREKEDEP
jgi:hypothetical protein